MKNLKSLFFIALAVGALQTAYAVDHASESKTDPVTSVASTDMTDGEVKKIDKSTNKITIKHSEIKNLDMPGMTMVFKVKDPAVLDTLNIGDKVKFRAEKIEGAITVISIQIAK
jgi:Cu/Ag efflux protein CusF